MRQDRSEPQMSLKTVGETVVALSIAGSLFGLIKFQVPEFHWPTLPMTLAEQAVRERFEPGAFLDRRTYHALYDGRVLVCGAVVSNSIAPGAIGYVIIDGDEFHDHYEIDQNLSGGPLRPLIEACVNTVEFE